MQGCLSRVAVEVTLHRTPEGLLSWAAGRGILDADAVENVDCRLQKMGTFDDANES